MDATPVAAKLNPNKKVANKSTIPKHTTPEKMEHEPEKAEKSTPMKKTPSPPISSLGSPEARGAVADAGREINMLASQFADVLSERAANETAQMKKLQDILDEARNLESFLKGKKNLLRERLDVISVKLQD